MILPEGFEEMTDDEIVAALVAEGCTAEEATDNVDLLRNGPPVD